MIGDLLVDFSRFFRGEGLDLTFVFGSLGEFRIGSGLWTGGVIWIEMGLENVTILGEDFDESTESS